MGIVDAFDGIAERIPGTNAYKLQRNVEEIDRGMVRKRRELEEWQSQHTFEIAEERRAVELISKYAGKLLLEQENGDFARIKQTDLEVSALIKRQHGNELVLKYFGFEYPGNVQTMKLRQIQSAFLVNPHFPLDRWGATLKAECRVWEGDWLRGEHGGDIIMPSKMSGAIEYLFAEELIAQ